MAEPQFLIDIVHSLETLRKIMNNSFMVASSSGKDSRVFRFRCSVKFSDSTASVAYIALRISGENFMCGTTSFQRPCHVEIAGYFPSHFSANRRRAAPTASAQGARQISLRSAATVLRSLVWDKPRRVVHDVQMNLGRRGNGADRLGKPGKVVHRRYQRVANAPVLQLVSLDLFRNQHESS